MSEPGEVGAKTWGQDGAPAMPARRSLLARGMARTRSAIASSVGALGDLLMPPLCLACHEPLGTHDALCPACWGRIDFIRPPLCDRLGLPLPYDVGGVMISAAAAASPPAYDRARAVARYDGVMRALIHDLKFHDRHEVRHLLGRWLTEAGRELLADAQLLIPVPLNRLRLLERRFNQSAILAEEVARATGIAHEPMALVRTRRTRPQVGLAGSARRENVAGAFSVPAGMRHRVEDGKIVLIDDVITTGATAQACARALRQAGARRVDVLALALVSDVSLAST